MCVHVLHTNNLTYVEQCVLCSENHNTREKILVLHTVGPPHINPPHILKSDPNQSSFFLLLISYSFPLLCHSSVLLLTNLTNSCCFFLQTPYFGIQHLAVFSTSLISVRWPLFLPPLSSRIRIDPFSLWMNTPECKN